MLPVDSCDFKIAHPVSPLSSLDIYSALRLGDSCIGRGFFSVPCPQSGDPCINNCTGGERSHCHPYNEFDKQISLATYFA